MMVLPIVARELRVAARARGTYGSRMTAAALALVVSVVLWLSMRWAPPHEVSRAIFLGVSWLAFLVCLGSGLWLTCDSLSEEKREGTLGLLFLTDLRGYDVILGKLAASAFNAAGCVLAVVPVLGLTILMGGMTVMEIVRTALALAAALWFSLGLGLVVSAQFRGARQVFGWMLFLLLIIAAAMPVIGAFWLGRWEDSAVGQSFLLLSPGCAMVCAQEDVYAKEAWPFWASLGITLGQGWLALLLACWLIPRRWQAVDETLRTGSLREMWQRFWGGGSRWRRRFRDRWLPRNPYGWLCSRDRWARYVVWIPFGAMALIWVWGYYEERRQWFDEGIYITTGLILGTVYKMWFGYRAAQQLGEDRRMGTLELMLSTPLDARQILAGQWASLRWVFGPPLGLFLLIILTFGLAALGRHEDYGGLNPFLVVFALRDDLVGDDLYFWKYAAYVLVFVADIWALGWLSMWLSFRLARPNRAAILAALLVLPLPWLLWGIFILLFVFLVEAVKLLPNDLFRVGNRDYTGQILLFSWLISCWSTAALWAWYARWRLQNYLRLVATTPVGTKPKYKEAASA